MEHGSAKHGAQAIGLSELDQLERELKIDRFYSPLPLDACGMAGSPQYTDKVREHVLSGDRLLWFSHQNQRADRQNALANPSSHLQGLQVKPLDPMCWWRWFRTRATAEPVGVHPVGTVDTPQRNMRASTRSRRDLVWFPWRQGLGNGVYPMTRVPSGRTHHQRLPGCTGWWRPVAGRWCRTCFRSSQC